MPGQKLEALLYFSSGELLTFILESFSNKCCWLSMLLLLLVLVAELLTTFLDLCLISALRKG